MGGRPRSTGARARIRSRVCARSPGRRAWRTRAHAMAWLRVACPDAVCMLVLRTDRSRRDTHMIRHMIDTIAREGYASPLGEGDGWLWVHVYAYRTGEWV